MTSSQITREWFGRAGERRTNACFPLTSMTVSHVSPVQIAMSRVCERLLDGECTAPGHCSISLLGGDGSHWLQSPVLYPGSFRIFWWKSPGISSFPITHIPVKKQQGGFWLLFFPWLENLSLRGMGKMHMLAPLFLQVCISGIIMCSSLYGSFYCTWHPDKYLNLHIRFEIIFMLYDMNGFIFVPAFTFLEL